METDATFDNFLKGLRHTETNLRPVECKHNFPILSHVFRNRNPLGKQHSWRWRMLAAATSEFHHLPKLHGFVGDPLCQQSFATASGHIGTYRYDVQRRRKDAR